MTKGEATRARNLALARLAEAEEVCNLTAKSLEAAREAHKRAKRTWDLADRALDRAEGDFVLACQEQGR